MAKIGRPRKERTFSVGYRLDGFLFAKAEKEARHRGVGVNTYLRQEAENHLTDAKMLKNARITFHSKKFDEARDIEEAAKKTKEEHFEKMKQERDAK